jgi:hypothetical protein
MYKTQVHISKKCATVRAMKMIHEKMQAVLQDKKAGKTSGSGMNALK